VIIGVGNPMRGDDAFGSSLAQRLAGRIAAHVIDAEDVPESYLWTAIAAQPDTILFLDAVDLGAAPGAAALLDPEQIACRCVSTHHVPLAMMVEVLRRETGASVALLAMQPSHIEFARPMSPTSSAALSCLEGLLMDVLPLLTEDSHAGAASARMRILAERAASW